MNFLIRLFPARKDSSAMRTTSTSWFTGLVALALFGLSGMAGAQVTVTLTAPANNSTSAVSTPITLTASTTGTFGRIRFKQNGNFIGTGVFNAPYTTTYTPSVAGTYVFVAEAWTGNSVVATSQNVSVIVGGGGGNASPTVSLAATPSSASAPATFTLTATAADSDGTISSVSFYDGASLITTDTSSPYTATLTSSIVGSHSLTAVATDNGGASTTSSAVSVSVTSGGGNTPPTVSLSATPSSASAPATFSLTATAADSDGTVNSVSFYDGASLISSDTSSPYTATLTTSVAGSHSLTAVATDNGGASTTSSAVSVSVTSGGGGGPTSLTRTYVYDANERLCKTIDPEAGATVMDYDAAGNIAWIASGTSWTANTCDRNNVGEAEKTKRTYDEMSRLTKVTTPGDAANVTTTYSPDGLVASLVATNGAGGAYPVTTNYTYNKRRLLATESQPQPAYTLTYGYDPNAHLSSLQYPDTQTVTYSVDALGRVTSVQAGTQVYASGVTYWPNGAISGFTYGNGVVHTMGQNLRQLPTHSLDQKTVTGVTTTVLDDTYAFDQNGNVDYITDALPGDAYNRSRDLGYDGLDRMIVADAQYQWVHATYSYDAIDNIRTAVQGTRSFTYTYDTVSNRLTNISGTASYAFGYDTRGNLTNKGPQDFTFDSANRMTTAELLAPATGVQTYRYDGTGRRTQTTDPGGQLNLWMYSKAGMVMYNHDERRGVNLSYIYLGNSQVATRTFDYTHGGAVSIRWQHTDALGSPVAETGPADANGNITVLKRNSYAPYGEAYGTTSIDGTGYAGHVMDRDTGLTYMQQRYYDPQIGRFLSVDPAAAGAGNFNRFWYANDNPYRFTDPDGRIAIGLVPLGVMGGLEQLQRKTHRASPEMIMKIKVVAKSFPSPKRDTEARAYISPDLTSTGVTTDGCTDHSCDYSREEASSGGAAVHLHNSISLSGAKAGEMVREFPSGGDAAMVDAGSVNAVKTPSGAIRLVESFFGIMTVRTIEGGNPVENRYIQRNWKPYMSDAEVANLASSYKGPYP